MSENGVNKGKKNDMDDGAFGRAKAIAMHDAKGESCLRHSLEEFCILDTDSPPIVSQASKRLM